MERGCREHLSSSLSASYEHNKAFLGNPFGFLFFIWETLTYENTFENVRFLEWRDVGRRR